MLRFTAAIILSFSLAFCCAQSDESSIDADVEASLKEFAESDYDILTLAQSWPQSSCWDLNKRWQSAAGSCSPCKMPKAKESWTIHGLWPSNRKGKHPSYCDDKYKFNAKLLGAALRQQLQEKWPTFNLNMATEAFWGHEWKKHGTCALDLESTSSLPKYFSKSAQLLDAYNVGAILADSGVVPGNKYKSDDVVKVVEKTLGVNTYVKCSMNTITNEYYLTEIHVCFDKSFKPADCSAKSKVTCSGKQVVYPPSLKAC